MRALLPQPADDVDLLEAYKPSAQEGRPFVRCNMISSVDGAITVGGRSGRLGGAADRQLFHLLRSFADAILVGAGTARAEGYGPARLSEAVREQRRRRGQEEVPPIAVVTGTGRLDWTSPFFTEAEARPIVFTTSATKALIEKDGESVADVVAAGDARVQPALALDHLHRAGYRSVLLEGGPGLNADVVEAGLLDELCLTVAPRVVAGSGPHVLAGAELDPPLALRVDHLLEEDGFLFYRLAVSKPAT